jgi:Zn-dependent protease
MSPADPAPPSAAEIERLGPWGAAQASAIFDDEPVAAEPAIREPTLGSQIGWGVVSTLLLAGWLGWRWGWIYAAAGVLGVLVHELGHLAAINAMGCGPGRIQIIPFFGGAASMRRAPDTEFKSVLIAWAGPVSGLIAAAPFYLLYVTSHDPVWLKGVLIIGGLNLLNLAPAPPLDGAKILGPALAWIHPNLERGVMILLGALAVYWSVTHGQILLAAFIGLGLVQAVMGRAPRAPAQRLSLVQWLTSIGLWVLALVLCIGVSWSGLGQGV